MTKRVRIENADTSDFKVVVQIWNKSSDGSPDTLAREIALDYPTALTPDDVYLHSGNYIIVKEK